MGEIEFSKRVVKLLDTNTLQIIIRKAVTRGFRVQGFTKNVWLAPDSMLCAALERKNKGRYQSSIFLDALDDIDIEDEIIILAKKWIHENDKRNLIEEEIEQIESNQKVKRKKEIIEEKKDIQVSNIEEKDNREQDIQQLHTKNKKLKNIIQELRIVSENQQKEITRLQKDNGKLQRQFEEELQINDELRKYIDTLKISIHELEEKVESCELENTNYQEILKKAPKVLCFSKRKISRDNFPFYNIKQLYEWSDEYESTIKWNEYKEIWVIETDFSYSEVIKMKKIQCKRIILSHNIKSLIEKVGGYNNGYAR